MLDCFQRPLSVTFFNIWPDKIRREILKKDFRFGGLKAPDIEQIDQSLKLRQFWQALEITNHPIREVQKCLLNHCAKVSGPWITKLIAPGLYSFLGPVKIASDLVYKAMVNSLEGDSSVNDEKLF